MNTNFHEWKTCGRESSSSKTGRRSFQVQSGRGDLQMTHEQFFVGAPGLVKTSIAHCPREENPGGWFWISEEPRFHLFLPHCVGAFVGLEWSAFRQPGEAEEPER